MASPLPPLVLLGPQRHNPVLAAVLDELDIRGPIAAVTAGWQEREEEVEEMREHLGRPVLNLLLYRKSEEVFARHPELAQRYRQRQDELKALQQIYRLRLSHVLQAAREVMRQAGPARLLIGERRSAIKAVRSLDTHHLRRVRAVHRDFDAEAESLDWALLEDCRQKIAGQLAECGALAIAGGHVAVLLNRLRLFGVLELAAGMPIIAWSAGAMVLGGKVVLFHDHPPQGAGDAEVLEEGLGLCPDVLPLPHASRRLRLNDPVRVALFARRFSPAVPVALDPGSRLTRLPDGRWRPQVGTHRLTRKGSVSQMGASR